MRFSVITSALALTSAASAAITAQQMTSNIDAITQKVPIHPSLDDLASINCFHILVFGDQ